MKKWLYKQWRASLAKSIWDDLTILGRATIWVPLWLLCWVTLPIILLGALIVFSIMRLLGRLPTKKIPPILFK